MWFLIGVIIGLIVLDYYSILKTNKQVKNLQKQEMNNTIEIMRLTHKLNYYEKLMQGDGK
jgi:hypothetical protein